MTGEAAGFWSYVRRDNEGDHDRILDLSNDVREQYRIQTTEPLNLFVDKDIQWGEAWEERINNAIAGATFFIPIITPNYFRSNACRQELLQFVREAERLGREQLLMSVYWVPVPELEHEPEKSADEAIRIVAKYNWQDFRGVSFEERDSTAYRKAVAALATELAVRAARAQSVADAPRQLSANAELATNADEPGVIDLIARAEEMMPVMVGLRQQVGVKVEESDGIMMVAVKQFQEVKERGKGMKATLAIVDRVALELGDLCREIASTGHEYGSALGEVDSGVRARLDLIKDHRELSPEDAQFLGEIDGLVVTLGVGAEELQWDASAAEGLSTLSRSLRPPMADYQAGLQKVLDGNAVIEEWRVRVGRIRDTHGGNGGQDIDEMSNV